MIGQYKSYEELEENLSLPELFATIEAVSENRMKDFRFHASLQGISLDGDKEGDSKFEEIKRRGIERAVAEKTSSGNFHGNVDVHGETLHVVAEE